MCCLGRRHVSQVPGETKVENHAAYSGGGHGTCEVVDREVKSSRCFVLSTARRRHFRVFDCRRQLRKGKGTRAFSPRYAFDTLMRSRHLAVQLNYFFLDECVLSIWSERPVSTET